MNFDFSEAIDEIEIKIKLPLRIKMQAFCFLNKNPSETTPIIIEVKYLNKFFYKFQNLSDIEKELNFENLNVNFPPQCVYDLEYSKAFNIIFVFILSIGKNNYEIGNNFLFD